ncbi:hypothetical protein D3C72_1864450 [compost metagenome]
MSAMEYSPATNGTSDKRESSTRYNRVASTFSRSSANGIGCGAFSLNTCNWLRYGVICPTCQNSHS